MAGLIDKVKDYTGLPEYDSFLKDHFRSLEYDGYSQKDVLKKVRKHSDVFREYYSLASGKSGNELDKVSIVLEGMYRHIDTKHVREKFDYGISLISQENEEEVLEHLYEYIGILNIVEDFYPESNLENVTGSLNIFSDYEVARAYSFLSENQADTKLMHELVSYLDKPGPNKAAFIDRISSHGSLEDKLGKIRKKNRSADSIEFSELMELLRMEMDYGHASQKSLSLLLEVLENPAFDRQEFSSLAGILAGLPKAKRQTSGRFLESFSRGYMELSRKVFSEYPPEKKIPDGLGLITDRPVYIEDAKDMIEGLKSLRMASHLSYLCQKLPGDISTLASESFAEATLGKLYFASGLGLYDLPRYLDSFLAYVGSSLPDAIPRSLVRGLAIEHANNLLYLSDWQEEKLHSLQYAYIFRTLAYSGDDLLFHKKLVGLKEAYPDVKNLDYYGRLLFYLRYDERLSETLIDKVLDDRGLNLLLSGSPEKSMRLIAGYLGEVLFEDEKKAKR